jgi:hypothetical protein
MTETIKAWQCIGCGNLEAPQTCIGVCQYRKVELVSAMDHAEARAELAEALQQRDQLAALLRRFASVTPREGAWETALRRFQDEARAALTRLAEPRPSAVELR